MLTVRMSSWTNQTLDKHVGDSSDSDIEEKEDGELEEGEVEEEFDATPQQKDDAKENNRETNPTGSISEQESVNDGTNPSHAGSQKFRRREYSHHHPPQHQQSRSNNASGQSNEKRNKHEQRRKRPHSGEERDDRNRKNYKRGRFRGNFPDNSEDQDGDESMGSSSWPSRPQNRGQRKHPNENSVINENPEPSSSTETITNTNSLPSENKVETTTNNDEKPSPNPNEPVDEEMTAVDEKIDRSNRGRNNHRNNQSNSSMPIENRSRRYYDGNSSNNNMNRRANDRDRSSWQDRTGGNNSRYRSDNNSNANHGPPLCKFFMENRCMKGNECTFSHDYKPAKKIEVCKFYVQNKGFCQKQDSCPYLHREFPCKFFHTGNKDCKHGDRCKFSHDPITDDDLRLALERYVSDSEENNRQIRNNGNNNNNHHHISNNMSNNFDMPNAASAFPQLTDPPNFPCNIPRLMGIFLSQNSPLAQTNPIGLDTKPTLNIDTNLSNTMVSRANIFNETLNIEKNDNEDSGNMRTVVSANSTSPRPSSSTSPSTSNLQTNTIPIEKNATMTANTAATNTNLPSSTNSSTLNNTVTNPTCPLPLPPTTMGNPNLTLPSPFSRLPNPTLNRPNNSILPPHPLFPLNGLGTGRVPIIFPPNSGLTIPPPPPAGSMIDMEFLAQAALAAVANKLTVATHHPAPSTSPQVGGDIDERDRQPTTVMRGDIDERPADVFNRNPNIQSTNASSLSSTSLSNNDEPLKTNTIQDIFRNTRPNNLENLVTTTTTATTTATITATTTTAAATTTTSTTNNSASPSFDFITMLEQLKQAKQTRTTDSNQDPLEIRTSFNPSTPYIVRPVYVSFKPYPIPDSTMSNDPRFIKYQEKMSQWCERARFDRQKFTTGNSFPAPNRAPVFPLLQTPHQQSTSMNENNLSRDPRLLRNSVSNSKIGVQLLPTNPFV